MLDSAATTLGFLSATVLDSAGALSAALSALRFRFPDSIGRTRRRGDDVDTSALLWAYLFNSTSSSNLGVIDLSFSFFVQYIYMYSRAFHSEKVTRQSTVPVRENAGPS